MRRSALRTFKRLQALALAAIITAGVILCSGSTLISADIGQPEITVPPLTDVHCASYCVYDSGYRKEGEWALNIRSVIVFGRIEIIEDRDRLPSYTNIITITLRMVTTVVKIRNSRSGRNFTSRIPMNAPTTRRVWHTHRWPAW